MWGLFLLDGMFAFCHRAWQSSTTGLSRACRHFIFGTLESDENFRVESS